MVGKQASTDGSVMTAHSCDGNYRTWLQIEPRRSNPAGAQRPIYWGKLHTETPDDMRGMRLKGSIPEIEQTYRYFNVAYPAMNEKGLAIGETTIGGRRELRNDEGLFLIENLQAIALERTTTARDAIRLIGELVKEYGYGDWGECLTFADSKEVWHFEIMGAGPLEVGAVWAAVRIPDNHVGVSANIPRISDLNLDDPDHYMASENVFSLAEEMGYWDRSSGEPFKWWKAYGNVDREGNPRRPYSVREFYVLSTLAPSLNLTMDMEELPFSVEPDEKVSVRDVLAYYRETYEGTEFDMTKNLIVPRRLRRGQTAGEQLEMVKSPVVNPWSITSDMGHLLNTIKPGTVETVRTIAVARCSYSQVIQARDWLPPEIGTVAWFSFDNPGQSPRIPIWAGVTELPESFKVGCQKRYRTDSACWWFRRANRLAMIKWGWARQYIEGAVREYENQAFDEVPLIEQKALELMQTANGEDSMTFREFLTRYTHNFSRATMQQWWELGDFFWAEYARGW
ncbi:MAG: peptidase [Gemmatimonadales bacterium]|nr:peptidase [Gemmatimonadales bacterium]NIN13195.1 peptidase [Gemmatimonadales bacterium]NIN51473.1 peptidase [Gemmatimonadales bacterium]NIP08937.1 peptidase [Gemmatimonadales bacterium]NIR03725.1 peptidase [Gemmatimonadales bacterium]